MSNDPMGPGTYMTEQEAKEFHNLFVFSTGFFVTVAVIAHILMWMWRPWFPGTGPYKAGTAATASLQTGASAASKS